MDEIETPALEAASSRREPIFNLPPIITVLCVGLIALYGLQRIEFGADVPAQFAASGPALLAGRWQTLFTSLFVHASWAHVLVNSLTALAFGPPVARLTGRGARGAAAFTAFYIVCGVIAGLGFGLTDAKDSAVGASGAISGLVGGATRIIEGRGRIGPLFGRTVIVMTLVWTIANVVFGVSGLTPGAFGMQVAWQAHVAGYFAGLLLIGPLARLAGPGRAVFTQ